MHRTIRWLSQNSILKGLTENIQSSDYEMGGLSRIKILRRHMQLQQLDPSRIITTNGAFVALLVRIYRNFSSKKIQTTPQFRDQKTEFFYMETFFQDYVATHFPDVILL